jgi:hypothetical protein
MKVILNITYFPVILFSFDPMACNAIEHAYQTRLLRQCKFHAATSANSTCGQFYQHNN